MPAIDAERWPWTGSEKNVKVRDRSLFKCQGGGGGAKKSEGGVMWIFFWLVVGVAINFDFPAGGGGSCLNCSNNYKIIKKILARSCFIN